MKKVMPKINWKVRFTFNNWQFIVRFFIAVFIPVLAYFGVEMKDLTSWAMVGDIIMKAINNPFVVGTMIVSAINVLFDPTTKGLSDSSRVMDYSEPNHNVKSN